MKRTNLTVQAIINGKRVRGLLREVGTVGDKRFAFLSHNGQVYRVSRDNMATFWKEYAGLWYW